MREGEVVVRMRPGTSLDDLRRELPGFGDISPLFEAEDDCSLWALLRLRRQMPVPEAIARASQAPSIVEAQPNLIYSLDTNDPLFSKQWQWENTGQLPHSKIDADVDAPEAWAIQTGHPSTRIAILDTGIALDHPDLAGRYELGPNIQDPGGSLDDKMGHGTHVAGLAGAASNNNIGVAGMCWGCTLYIIKISDESKDVTTAAIARGIQAAINGGATIVNISAGMEDDDPAVQSAIQNAQAAGIVIVASAGNSGDERNHWPASYAGSFDNVISVAGTTLFDTHGTYSTSNDAVTVAAPGGRLDPGQVVCDPLHRKQNVGGPGECNTQDCFVGDNGVLSTTPTGDFAEDQCSDPSYGTMVGTSMAAPIVAGLAGLIDSEARDRGLSNWSNPAVRRRSIKNIIARTAEDKSKAGWDKLYGFGRVNAFYALRSTWVFGFPGDIDRNGLIDGWDLIAVSQAFGSRQGDSNYNVDADIDKNGLVDGNDLAYVTNDFGEHVQSNSYYPVDPGAGTKGTTAQAISLAPFTFSGQVGDTFTTLVRVSNAEELSKLNVTVRYSPDLLEVTNITGLAGGLFPTVGLVTADDQRGEVFIGTDRTRSEESITGKSFDLASITFRLKVAGSAAVSFGQQRPVRDRNFEFLETRLDPASDLVPPRRPVNLRLVQRARGFVQVAWDHGDPGDVQQYRIYRRSQDTGACDGAGMTLIGSTSSLSFTDSSANLSWLRHCYAVSAVDASGNESLLSTPLAVAPMAPDLTSINPRSGTPFGGEPVRFKGDGFDPRSGALEVRLNGSVAAISNVGGQGDFANVTTPPASSLFEGLVDARVTNLSSGLSDLVPQAFEYIVKPAIASINGDTSEPLVLSAGRRNVLEIHGTATSPFNISKMRFELVGVTWSGITIPLDNVRQTHVDDTRWVEASIPSGLPLDAAGNAVWDLRITNPSVRGDDQVATFRIKLRDTFTPSLIDRYPYPGSVGAATNTLIVAHVRDLGAGVRGDSIAVRVIAGGSQIGGNLKVDPAPGSFPVAASYRVAFRPEAPFSNGQLVTVQIDAADDVGHAMGAGYSFTTTAGLVTGNDQDNDAMPDDWEMLNSLDTSPADGATGVSGPGGDPDQDARENIKELDMGTDATPAMSIVTGPGAALGVPALVRTFSRTGYLRGFPNVSGTTGFAAYGTLNYGVHVAAADFDGDGVDEIATGPGPGQAYAPRIRIFESDGRFRQNDQALFPGLPGYGVHVGAGDIDGDGLPDIVVTAEPTTYNPDATLYAWKGTGATVAGFPILLSGYPTSLGIPAPVVTDLDRDGDVEVLINAYFRIYAFDLPSPTIPSNLPWPMYQRDPTNSAYMEPPVDTVPPYVQSASPAAGAAGAAPQPLIRVQIRDDLGGVRAKSLQLFLDGSQVTPSLVVLPDVVEATYTPLVPFPPGQSVSVRVRVADGGWPFANILDTNWSFSVTTLADGDGDSLPDLWESENGLDPGDGTGEEGAAGDPDGDGLDNAGEYAQGRDPTSAATILTAAGPGRSYLPFVRGRYDDGRATAFDLLPYGTRGYGVNVAGGQIDSDGLDEVLTGPGPNPAFGPQVRGFRADEQPLAKVSFFSYGTLRYGVKPGSGDIDGDGIEEILSAPGPGAVFGPHVRAFNFDGKALSAIGRISFFAYATLEYGANVAAGDIDADGFAEMTTGPGPGAIFGAQLRGFDYDGTQLGRIARINAYVFPGARYGLHVSSGDIDSDGYADMASGRGPGPAEAAELALMEFDTGVLKALPGGMVDAFPGSFGGATSAIGDLGGDRRNELVAGSGPLAATVPRVRGYAYAGGLSPVSGVDFLPENDVVRYGAVVATALLER